MRKVENTSIAKVVDYLQEMLNNASFMVQKLEPLKKITDPGEMLEQLKKLCEEEARVDKKFTTLSLSKTKVDLRVDALVKEVELLKGANTLLKNDKVLLEGTNNSLAELISAKDKELEAANTRASLATQEKASLEAKVKDLLRKLTEAKSDRAADRVSLKAYDVKQHDLQVKMDRLSHVRVDHSEVSIIEEKSAALEKLKCEYDQL